MKPLADSLAKVIRHERNKWVLYSHDGSKQLGEFDSEGAAQNREREIQYFKSKKDATGMTPKDVLNKLKDSIDNLNAVIKGGPGSGRHPEGGPKRPPTIHPDHWAELKPETQHDLASSYHRVVANASQGAYQRMYEAGEHPVKPDEGAKDQQRHDTETDAAREYDKDTKYRDERRHEPYSSDLTDDEDGAKKVLKAARMLQTFITTDDFPAEIVEKLNTAIGVLDVVVKGGPGSGRHPEGGTSEGHTKDEQNALTFAQKYPGEWHTHATDARTMAAITGLAGKKLIEHNKDIKAYPQFRFATNKDESTHEKSFENVDLEKAWTDEARAAALEARRAGGKEPKQVSVPNSKARDYVNARQPFKGHQMYGEYHPMSGHYAVYSYGEHFPMYVHNGSEWHGNSDKYSPTTSKQQNQAKPDAEIHYTNTEGLKHMLDQPSDETIQRYKDKHKEGAK
jgi:hypothetical protein